MKINARVGWIIVFGLVVLASCVVILATLIVAIVDAVNANDDMKSPDNDVLDAITASGLNAHWKYFSSELLEGRYTGSRGESSAGLYAESQFTLWGLDPAGDNGTYYQYVPLQDVTPLDESVMTLQGTSGTLSLSWYYDYVATSPYPLSSLQTIELANEELVFVGYGINAPDLGWNDYKVNVTGKVLICFVGQPKSGVWADQPYRWYSRWVYKYEEASRQGAKAIFLVHTPSSAEYEWNVVQAGWGYAKARQEATSTAVPLLTGWVTEYYGGEIAASCNSTLEEWFNEAELAEFIPQPIPLDISVSVTFTCVDFSGTNTLGMKKGSTTETVVILGHIDGVGMKNGTVYPGAIDNAAGSSVVMEIAYAWSQMTLDDPLERSIIFLLATAEEAGLFGSDYFVNHLPTALEQGTKLVAGLNFDSPNTWGATYDMGGEGADKSTLGALEEWAAEKEDITFITGVSGSGYFRGDQWSLSKQGIPAIWPRQGTNFIDKPEHYLEDVVIPFESTCYHQPCDAYRENSDLSGMVQGARVGLRMAYALATGSNTPECINNCQ